MRFIIILILLILFSCGYPDIDSVPSFKELKLSDEELFDLCQLSSSDKSEIDNCIKEKQINSNWWKISKNNKLFLRTQD